MNARTVTDTLVCHSRPGSRLLRTVGRYRLQLQISVDGSGNLKIRCSLVPLASTQEVHGELLLRSHVREKEMDLSWGWRAGLRPVNRRGRHVLRSGIMRRQGGGERICFCLQSCWARPTMQLKNLGRLFGRHLDK